MKNSIIKFTLLLISTIVVFTLFVCGIVFFFVDRNKPKTSWLYKYVTEIINDEDYDDQYIGEVIVKDNIKKLKDIVSTFKPEDIRNETSLQSIDKIDNSVIWNKGGIDNPILIDNKLTINKSIITNLTFANIGNKELNINNSIIVGVSIENLHQLEKENVNVNINNSFVYLQANYLYDYPKEQIPTFSGNINNSLIGNRINYASEVEPYYFNNLSRGDLLKVLSNLNINDSYYDCVESVNI